MPAATAVRIVVPRYGAQIVGGSEGLARRLATTLATRGWDVQVWATTAVDESSWRGDMPREEHEASGVTVRRFPVTRRRHPRLFHQESRLFFRLPPALRPEGAWIRAQGPDSPALVRALGAADSVPTLFTPYLYQPTLFGLPAAPHPRLLMPAAHDERPLHLRSVGRAIRAADALWYHSHEERELLERVHPGARGLPAAEGTVGVEPPVGADPGHFRGRFAVYADFLLYGGRTATGKGLETLYEGFSRLRQQRPDTSLVIAGDAASSMAPGVSAVGPLDEATWADAIAASSAVVVPSRLESLSMLALEAWAAGKPCLLNGTSPVLRGHASRSGGALTFTSPSELAAAALRLLEDAALADGLGQAGRAYVAANFRWDDVVSRLSSLIAEAERVTTR